MKKALPAGIDPDNVPLSLAAAMLGRHDLDALAARIPIHTWGPAGKGVRRFTTMKAIESFRQPHPSAPVKPARARVSADLARMREALS